jgi:alkanesulfonate monooxygenase SsuD/methylene tetrahydromethanopterin reductase-like flavin-dependent oxidoreductase (luciferase family)
VAILQSNDASLVLAVNAARRALIILTVPWSGPDRTARVAFRAAAEELATNSPELKIATSSIAFPALPICNRFSRGGLPPCWP